MTNLTEIRSPLKWSSPIKVDRNAENRPSLSSAKRRLFFEESEESPLLTLSEIFSFNLDRPAPSDNVRTFFVIREVVEAINDKLSRFIDLDPQPCIERVRILLNHHDHQYKLGELGMVLFYLDRDQPFPDAESLILYRALEIDKEACSYLTQHASSCDNPLIPSGKTHYIQRAFAHMVLTSDQTYNRGGLEAIRKILSDPHYFISKHLQPEHREHILTIAEQIINNPSFPVLFAKKITVHPDLTNLIRLDLKLAPDHPINSVFVYYDCLMALFADIRQKDTPNCYAIGALIYMTENYTYEFMSKTIEWLQQGYISIGENNTIPLMPVIEKRLKYSKDLNVELKFQQAVKLTTLEHISDTLHLETIDTESDRTLSIGTTLSKLLEDNARSEHLPYAEKLYFAYKCNALILLNLAVSELVHMNGPDLTKSQFSTCSKPKALFLDACLSGIYRGARKRTYSSQFMDPLLTKLHQRIWLENCNEQEVFHIGTRVVTNCQRVARFEGDPETLCGIFKRSLRVFELRNNRYELLPTISDLQTVIIDAARETSTELSLKRLQFTTTKDLVIQAILSRPFRIAVSNYCSDQIHAKGIRGVDLNRSDLLLLNQIGGFVETTIDQVYNVKVGKQVIANCSTPYQFLENLIEKFPTFDKDIFRTSPKILLFTPGDHIWTLTPYTWKILIENQNGFYQFIQQTVFKPAHNRLQERIPHELMKRVIKRYTSDRVKQQDIKDHFFKQSLITFDRFQSDFFANLNPNNINFARRIIEEEFSSVTLSKNSLSTILRSLNINLNSVGCNALYRTLPSLPTQPFLLARAIRDKLIEEQIAIPHPYDVERAIYEAYRLPMTFLIGDLNWVHDDSESPCHIGLSIGFSYTLNTLVYRVRDKEEETTEPNHRYEHIEIMHPPTIISSSKGW
jgi:hypothetical protein